MYQEFLKSMAGTSIGHTVATNLVLFPTLETLHFIGLALLVGGIAALDLRVLGFGKGLTVKPFHKLLPLVFLGLGINVVSGVLFFVSDPVGYGNNTAFQFKMVFLVLAGLNALGSRGGRPATGQGHLRPVAVAVGRRHCRRPHDAVLHGAAVNQSGIRLLQSRPIKRDQRHE